MFEIGDQPDGKSPFFNQNVAYLVFVVAHIPDCFLVSVFKVCLRHRVGFEVVTDFKVGQQNLTLQEQGIAGTCLMEQSGLTTLGSQNLDIDKALEGQVLDGWCEMGVVIAACSEKRVEQSPTDGMTIHDGNSLVG